MIIMNNSGLSKKEVNESRIKYGSNKLTLKRKNSFFKLVLESLSDPIIKILLIALAIKILFLFKDSNVYETLGIAVAVFLASFISAISEYGSEKAFEKLSNENSLIKVKVLRDSIKQVINMDEVVVGDIVFLESGDKVPADGIIIDGELYVDESYLTGETLEKHKRINDIVYMGSIVSDKKGIIKITLVGDKTFYGRIASDIQEKSLPSPLKLKLTDLAKTISRFGYIGAFLVFISYMLNAVFIPNHFIFENIFNGLFLPHLIYALTLSVAVIVMAVPEGLPMMITLVLSSNMKRLLNKNVLVRKLVGIETSGSLDILFTDKTGTLTEGKLKVISFVNGNLKEYDKYSKINKEKFNDKVYLGLIYNNESFLVGNRCEGGNTTDKAIMEFVGRDDKSKYKIIDKTDFNSKIKYSSVVTNYENESIFYKGAYEAIIDRCLYYIDENNNKKILDKDRLYSYIKDRTKSGIRVLAVSMKNNDNYHIFIGLILLKDNIRKESYEAIKTIKNAGIQVVMVTGDALETATSVANELGLLEGEDNLILTSEEFNNMSDEYIKSNLSRIRVLSRSLPEDKNRLVRLSMENGLVSGMTGDGVNDAPALKRASVGFSMGSGTEIAKETSDIVILDNNINSICTAILYGRAIYKSIRKFIIFQLSVNCCAVLLSIIGPFLGILSPITVVQVLWVNMVMDTFAGLAFSFEPALKEYMNNKQENSSKIINNYMKNQIFCDGIYSMLICIWFLKSKFISSIYRYDINDKYLMTAFFGLFIFIDIFIAFNSRTHRINTFSDLYKNKIFLIIFIIISIIQITLIYYGGELFRTTGLTLYEFEIMILVSFSVIPFDIIRKIILKRKRVKMGV